jgi:chemotaxis protein methyltransferase CheR
MGLSFPRERWRELRRGISSAAREFGFEDAESSIEWLLSSSLTKNQIEILASHLTVGETYFFREMNSLEILADRILPELIRSRREGDRHLRIWSVACSTGEEPYSVAILLDKLLPDINKWRVTITATDLNPSSLQKASEGVYGEWSFRRTPPWIRQEYFRKNEKENRFEISPRIKGMVSFSYLNLATDTYPSLLNNTNAMDVILCRNVLMYFTSEQANRVIRRLNLSLVDGGWLIVSPVDSSPALSSGFVPINFPHAILYKKDGKQPVTMEAPALRLDTETEVLSPLPLGSPTTPEPEIVSPPEKGHPFPLEAEVQLAPYEEALALYGQGNYGEAADRVLELVSLNEEDSNALALLARVYANQGKLAEALVWCEKAVATDKWHPGLHCLLANILQEQGQIGPAAASLKRALYLDHNFVLAHFALGNLSRQQGKSKESEKHFQNALSLLRTFDQEEILPESEGLTAGRLVEIINAMGYRDVFA